MRAAQTPSRTYNARLMSVRVRMAPSPTGFLHIGGVRTFLFNWLFARGRGGECLLRIENTDTGREVAESVEQIEQSLRWLGIDWDGETRFQLDGAERCRTEAARLVAEGKAYEDDGAIRIRMPKEGVIGWDDAIKGRIEFPAAELEDMVILRSDGRPVYNFASPVDDWVDGITHVIRGDDHVSNTPKQIVVLEALGAELPVYAHAPNVFGEDGKKLSKRHGAVSVGEFRDAGYIAPALMNFLALLGWAPDGETTIMSRDELVERFTLERVGVEPGDVRLREARLDERALPARARRRRLRRRAARLPARAGQRLGRGARSVTRPRSCRRRSAAWASSPTSPASCSRRSSPIRRCSTHAVLTEAANQLETVEPWDCRGDRGRAEGSLRAARGEAEDGLPADPRRRHRLADLARALREPRAARARRLACAPTARCFASRLSARSEAVVDRGALAGAGETILLSEPGAFGDESASVVRLAAEHLVVGRDRDHRTGLEREPCGVGAVHRPVLAADRDERDVRAVRLNRLGHSLDAARVAGVIEDVGAVPHDVADCLGSPFVIRRHSLDREASERRVVIDPEDGVGESAGTLCGELLASGGTDERRVA